MEKAYPSEEKEEKEMQRLMKSQTLLYETFVDDKDVNTQAEGVVDTEVPPEDMRQPTFG